ncbi:MAG: MFS transporter, partial [Alkalibacterium sp.]|nr:MFS transporter [Alkalibacterium sp.]
TALTLFTNSIDKGISLIVILLLCVVNAGYGGGFSNLPTLLSDRFGMDSIGAVHGLALSAWAFAGLSGNQLSAFIIKTTGSYNNVLYVTLALYILAMIISYTLVKPIKNSEF